MEKHSIRRLDSKRYLVQAVPFHAFERDRSVTRANKTYQNTGHVVGAAGKQGHNVGVQVVHAEPLEVGLEGDARVVLRVLDPAVCGGAVYVGVPIQYSAFQKGPARLQRLKSQSWTKTGGWCSLEKGDGHRDQKSKPESGNIRGDLRVLLRAHVVAEHL